MRSGRVGLQEIRDLRESLVGNTEYDFSYLMDSFQKSLDMMLSDLGFVQSSPLIWTTADGLFSVELSMREQAITGIPVVERVVFGSPSGSRTEKYGVEEKEIDKKAYLDYLDSIKDEIYRIVVGELGLGVRESIEEENV